MTTSSHCNKVKFGREERTVCSSLPNFTLISAVCHPCRVKNPKIGPWVKTIPASSHFVTPAGNKQSRWTLLWMYAVKLKVKLANWKLNWLIPVDRWGDFFSLYCGKGAMSFEGSLDNNQDAWFAQHSLFWIQQQSYSLGSQSSLDVQIWENRALD